MTPFQRLIVHKKRRESLIVRGYLFSWLARELQEKPNYWKEDIQLTLQQYALSWVGKEFNPGVGEQCMAFVRYCLEAIKSPLAEKVTTRPYDGLSTSRNLASSLSGADCGTILSSNLAMPGDIAFHTNTYGDYPEGTITHVSIIVGSNGEIVHRPTSSRPVEKSNISVFKTPIVLRPAQGADKKLAKLFYNQDKNKMTLVVDGKEIQVSHFEGTFTLV